MPRQRTRLHYKKLVDKIIDWLNADIDKVNHNDNKEVQEYDTKLNYLGSVGFGDSWWCYFNQIKEVKSGEVQDEIVL